MTFQAGPGLAPLPSAALERLAPRWKSLVGFGVLMVLLAVVAFTLIVASTLASVLLLGVVMAVTGVVEIAMAFRSRSWGRFFVWAIAGIFYLIAGTICLGQPMFAATAFTLILGAGLMATGVLRIVLGLGMGGAGQARGAVVLAGVVTLLLGLVIVMGWPGNSPFVLGALLSADLLLYGITWITLGLAIRKHAPSP